MIIEMVKVRLLGPRERLPEVLGTLQDLGVLHLAPPSGGTPLPPEDLGAAQQREQRHLQGVLDDVEWDLAELRAPPPLLTAAAGAAEYARWARMARRVRRALERTRARAATLEEERALILRYQQFFAAFRSFLETERRWPQTTAYHVLLRGSDVNAIPKLRAGLTAVVGDAFEIYDRRLPSGEVAVLVIVAAEAAGRVERLLSDARVEEIPVPAAYGGGALADAIPKMMARLSALPAEQATLEREREGLRRAHGPDLQRARTAIRDRLARLGALPLSGVTAHAFVLEGWLPASARKDFARRLREACGEEVIVSDEAREEWASEDAPVVLSNPALFRPFEAILKLLPLPQYGTIDPTPFVAVFFPAFFGIMVGDIGYGLLLGTIALLVRARSRAGTLPRSVAEIAGACAVFTVVAGVLYGELFGDLGRRWLGLRAIAFDREEAMIPFLILAVALGAVHVLLGLLLGVAATIRRHPRQALGRGVSAVMIAAIIVALLAVVEVLPHGFFTPAAVALLAAFPILIFAEGIVAPIELLSSLGNILSYARIMALGVASVMLAVVANRMVGAMGSAAVGVVFGLLFHLVNFAIALFSPTIHALRLHYVEFFGKFYSPGGVRYSPFGHWTRAAAPPRSAA
jgi:V/A-type H+/Na+-transporting ATPase subunit I